MHGNPGIPIRTEANMVRIIEHIRKGTPKSVAARAVGISQSAFYEWAKDDDVFRAKIDEAFNEWAAKMVARANEIAAGDGRDSAAMTMWLLERRVFAFFARKERLTTGGNGDPDDIAIEAASTEAPALRPDDSIATLLQDAEEVVAILRAAKGGDRPAEGVDGGLQGDAPEAVRPTHTNGSPKRLSAP